VSWGVYQNQGVWKFSFTFKLSPRHGSGESM
jgi:hypothetical protein